MKKIADPRLLASTILKRSAPAVAGAFLVGFAAPALAQQTEPSSTAVVQTPASEPEDDAAASEDLVVTGTRIVRDGFQSPTPLTVLDREEIQNQSPSNNLADFVNQIPSFVNSRTPANSRTALSSGFAGLNILNLRNLEPERTLVLFDGRRSVGSTARGYVDINTFPQALVRSVEVVTGGASAAYGSDAVAGVVNFVLDKKFEGLRVAADVGITEDGDGYNHSMTVSGGLPFADGRGRLTVSGEVARRDGIFDANRDWNRLGYRTVLNPAFAVGNGQPYELVTFQAGSNDTLPGGIISASTAVAGSGVRPNSLRGIYFGEGGQLFQYDYGSIDRGNLSVGGDWFLADNLRRVGLSPDEDRYGIFGRLSFEVADWIEVFAEASFNRQKTLFNGGTQATTSGPTVTLRGDNAFLINTLGAERLRGINTATVGTSHIDLPQRGSNNTREVERYAIGAEGAFPLFGKEAVWNAYVQYGETNVREQLRDILQLSRGALAVDAVFAPAGNALGVPAGTIVCRSSLTAPTNGCQPLNRLGIGVTSQAAADYVLGDPYRDQQFKQTVAGINLSTTPFATWGGDVSVAVGAEYRRDEISGFVPPEFSSGWQLGNFLATFGQSDVREAYLETVVPLGWGAEFNGAVRATDYSLSGYVTTWKTGLTWQPIDDIRFRVTRSRDIRAPNLSDLFAAGTSRVSTVANPFPDPVTGQPGTILTFRETTTGNQNLRPEEADSTSVGVVLQPRFVPGLSFSVDAYLIEVNGAIGQLRGDTIILGCFQGNQELCAAYGPDPTGDRDLLFNAQPLNFDRLVRRGIDYELTYRLPMQQLFDSQDGSLTFRALATNFLTQTIDTGFNEVVNTVGVNNTEGTPDWAFRGSLTYDAPDFSITAVGRGVTAGSIDTFRLECASSCPAYDPGVPAGAANLITTNSNRASGVFYADLNFTQNIRMDDAEMQFFVNVTNLFDRWPILLPLNGNVSASLQHSDLFGRAFRIGIRARTR